MKRIIMIFAMLAAMAAAQVGAQQVRWKAGELRVALTEEGYYKSIKVAGREVLKIRNEYPVVSVLDWKNEVIEPKRAIMHSDTLVCSMDDGETVCLTVDANTGALVLRVAACPEQYKALVFGPVGVKLGERVGEVSGSVLGGKTMMAMESLNAKTVAGIPQEALEAYTARFYYTGNRETAATTTEGGAVLQLSCRNRNPKGGMDAEVRQVGGCPSALAPCVVGEEGSIVGAGVVMFGCKRATFEKVEAERGWRAETVLICDYTKKDFAQVLERCRKAGTEWLEHPQPFVSYGHYRWRPEVAANDKEMKAMAETARDKGVALDVRVMANRISANDAYMGDKPSKHLLAQLQFSLIEDVSEADTVILVRTGMYSCFPEDMATNVIMIDDEIITYRQAADTVGFVTLYGCERGTMGTAAAAHGRNTRGLRLWNDELGFYGDLQLQDSIAERVKELVEKGGMRRVVVDRLEDCRYSGQDEYAMSRFLQQCGAEKGSNIACSQAFHYGREVGVVEVDGQGLFSASMRQSTLKRIVDTVAFAKRNGLAGVTMKIEIRCAEGEEEATSMESLEYVLSQAAALDLGLAIECRVETMEKHGEIDQLLEAVGLWEKLRKQGIDDELKKKLLSADIGIHLEEQGNDGAMLLGPMRVSNGHPGK